MKEKKKSRSGPTVPESERAQPIQRKARFTVAENVLVERWIKKHGTFRAAVLAAAKAAIVVLAMAGCVYPKTPEDERTERFERARIDKAERQAEHDRKRAAFDAEVAQRAEDQKQAVRAAAEAKQAEEAKKATDAAAVCDTSRAGRRERTERRIREYTARKALLDWAEEHCDVVDNGKPVVREYEMPNGVIVKRRVISGYPVRECDAKEPAGLPKYVVGNGYRTRGLVQLSPSDSRLDDECIDLDKAAGWDHIDYEAMGEEDPAKKK